MKKLTNVIGSKSGSSEGKPANTTGPKLPSRVPALITRRVTEERYAGSRDLGDAYMQRYQDPRTHQAITRNGDGSVAKANYASRSSSGIKAFDKMLASLWLSTANRSR